jgi:hypothetical protein
MAGAAAVVGAVGVAVATAVATGVGVVRQAVNRRIKTHARDRAAMLRRRPSGEWGNMVIGFLDQQ